MCWQWSRMQVLRLKFFLNSTFCKWVMSTVNIHCQFQFVDVCAFEWLQNMVNITDLSLDLIMQESLTNNKVSTWRNLWQINTRNVMLKNTFSGLQRFRWQYEYDNRGVYHHLCSYCCLPNLQNPRNFPKIWTYCSSRSFKVINLGAKGKHILLAINSNFGRISYHFRDIDAFSSKVACFPAPTLFDAP